MENNYQLIELKLELNRKCPLNCIHCSSNGMPNASEHIELNRVLKLISEFADLGGHKLSISGGEPLCYSALDRIIDSCRRSNISTTLYTTGIVNNGSQPKIISQKTASLLAETNTKAVFSIHGACANTHDILTQVRGSFESTIMAVERVTATGAPTELHVVPTALNFRELADIAKLALSLNIHKVSWLRFVPHGRGYFNQDILRLGRIQLGQLAQTKTRLQKLYPELTIRTGSPFNILCPEVPTPCNAGLTLLTIRPNGFIAPCDAFKQFPDRDNFGNIFKHPLAEVWNKSSLLTNIRTLHEAQIGSNCVSCPLFSRCNSGCPAQKAIAAGGLTDGRDPDCPLDSVEVRGDEIEAVSVY